MSQCQICGTRTGQHGFSFDDQALAMNAVTEKKHAGILMIPAELVPDGTDEDTFVAEFVASLTNSLAKRASIPEVRITHDHRS